jgi:hypothetical protein
MRSERQSAQYIRDQLVKSGKRRSVDDVDYFFKSLFPSLYKKVEEEKGQGWQMTQKILRSLLICILNYIYVK